MNDIILSKLSEIEQRENVRILFAAESGSRAWGFASPDSDYDVRFIYIRPRDFYLRLDPTRDVIELPVTEVLDINGWDLNKALKLMYKSNPTLFEWLSSPIVYRRDEEFFASFCALADLYCSPKGSIAHYMSMARNNCRALRTGEPLVKLKKYFYVLRPLLACLWINERGTRPPMEFVKLLDACLPIELRQAVDELLEMKMSSTETELISPVEVLDKFIDDTFAALPAMFESAQGASVSWAPLNEFFKAALT